MPVSVFAAKMLQRRYRQTCRRGRRFKTLTAEQRHALRIATKKLRYTAEFFSGVYSRKVTRPYIQKLSQLQNVFGTLNDQVVAQRLLAQIAGGDRLQDHASGVINGWSTCQSSHQLAAMTRVWKRFRRCGTFWENE